MEIFRINAARTLLVSGEIDDWGLVGGQQVKALPPRRLRLDVIREVM